MSIEHERKPFVIISKTVAEDTRLSSSDKVVMLTLCSFADGRKIEDRDVWPSRKMIRERAGVSDSTLTKSFNKLTEYGYLEIHERYKTDEHGNPTKERLSNFYLIKNV